MPPSSVRRLPPSRSIAAFEKAAEAVGGSSFLRTIALERLLRDIHGAQFHPLQAKRQHRFSGRVAFGLDPIDGTP